MVFFENPAFQAGVTARQTFDAGLQAHGASMLKIAPAFRVP
jgi:hypothetical protein